MKPSIMKTSLLNYEKDLWNKGHQYIAGVDEAGRGPLAGPLFVVAVILPTDIYIAGLDDSKKLTARKREIIYQEICDKALAINIINIPITTIDELNIYQATKQGMVHALQGLTIKPSVALIDAMPLENLPFETISLIHGDALSASIAAASVVAKVTRDKFMLALDEIYPEYKWIKNKGYGTKEHMLAIENYGITPHHRTSFEPVKTIYNGGGFKWISRP